MTPDPSDDAEAYVVLRADLSRPPGSPVESVVRATVVVRSLALAEREVTRLRTLHGESWVRYWYTPARLYPPGSAPSSGAPAA